MNVQSEHQYVIKTPVFEGPLELLLRLIEERKLFVNDISLAQVTDDYIAFIKSLENERRANLGEITGFISVAATLILIKSKSLLPGIALSADEEGQIDDLERRLRLYQAIKDILPSIKIKFGERIIFARPEQKNFAPVFSPDPAVSVEQMLASIREVVQNIPKKEFLPEVSVKKVVSIEEMMASLMDRIESSLKFNFSEFSRSGSGDKKEQKVYMIVSFLAMLELVRQGTLAVIQSGNFQDIEIQKNQ